ncbi:Uncharacterised protein [Segatella copri]|nr:Uncharacterised protein [Segatella copri]
MYYSIIIAFDIVPNFHAPSIIELPQVITQIKLMITWYYYYFLEIL